MSRRARFEVLRVEQRGYPVAVILDHVTEEQRMVYRRGSRVLNWDRGDTKVENQTLRRVARNALDSVTA